MSLSGVFRLFWVAATVLLMSGCAATIKDISEYRSAPLLEAEYMPSKDLLDSRRPQIVVFDADDSALKDRAGQVGSVLSRAVESRLAESGAEIIDRNLALALRDELALAEAKGQGVYQGPAVANFAVKASITNADFTSEYVQIQLVRTKKGTYFEPAHCNYRAKFSGSLRIYELPALRLLASVSLNGPAFLSSEEKCNKARAEPLIRQAVEEAVTRSRTEFQNVFAPKGYVIEKRIKGSDAIFKIMLGSTNGIKSQDKLAFFSQRQTVNPLTQKTGYEEIMLAEGVVSDLVATDYSWVIPADQDKAKKIRLGDFVKVVFKKSALESVGEKLGDVGGAHILDKTLRLWLP